MGTIEQHGMFVGAALLCAVVASVFDVREGRIPNRLTGTAMLAGLALHTAVGGGRGLANSAGAGVLAGCVFAVCYVAGGMGAGDVKLMAAVGCLAGMPAVGTVLIAAAMAGGVFGLALSVVRGKLRETLHNTGLLLLHHQRHGLKPHPQLNLASGTGLKIPFALPVAAGCLFAFWSVAWGGQS
jgi:prepilin peptidase CpaA